MKLPQELNGSCGSSFIPHLLQDTFAFQEKFHDYAAFPA